MASRSRGPGRNPAVIAFYALLVAVAIACVAAATADAAQYKMLLCAGNNGSNGFGTSTNTISGNNPGGIFSFENYCGPAPDPAGNAAHLRIVENQSGGNAGNGAYGFMYWDTPPYVHYKTAGGWTRQPNAFNDGSSFVAKGPLTKSHVSTVRMFGSGGVYFHPDEDCICNPSV